MVGGEEWRGVAREGEEDFVEHSALRLSDGLAGVLDGETVHSYEARCALRFLLLEVISLERRIKVPRSSKRHIGITACSGYGIQVE